MSDWTVGIVQELEEQYGIHAEVYGSNVKVIEVNLPAAYHSLDIIKHLTYGYIITLYVSDETGGQVSEEDIADTDNAADIADIVSTAYYNYGD